MKIFLACAPALLLLAACGSGESTSETSSTPAADSNDSASNADTSGGGGTDTGSNADDPEVVTVAAADPEPEGPFVPNAEDGRREFNACAICHTVGENDGHRVGPNIYAIYGAPAAQKEGFNYSPALTNSGLVWDDATLDALIENPQKLVPGNRMAYVGQRDAEKRANIIAYIKTLQASE